MAILDRLARWLEHEDQLTPADAILVLDGAADCHRLAAGLDLLRRGYAPRLVVSQTTYGGPGYQQAEALAGDQWKNIYWMPNDAASTRSEAIEARQTLKLLRSSSVLVVTSRYHTRRVKKIFSRELMRHGIQVRVIPATVPFLDGKRWWKSQAGRATVLLELTKLLCTWLRFDLPISNALRYRLKLWAERTIP